jgi:hypothetical protein
MPVLSHETIVTRALAWCRGQIAKLLFPRSVIGNSETINHPVDAGVLDIPRYSYDASLLFGRMALLRIDRDELARDDPLLLRELQGICTLCGSKEECLKDLAVERETGEPRDWQDYCPNVAMLNMLGALQNCPRAAQYFKTPLTAK